MRRSLFLALVLAMAGPPPFAAAQQSQSPPDPPVSLERIKRQLAQKQQVQSLDQLRLAYYVSVTANAPEVNIFKDFDWKHGRVPDSPPTARELFQQVTPIEFSAPVMDFTQVGAWLGSKIFHKKSSQ
jgi:hypothetical protein